MKLASQLFTIEHRPSDSPFVETVWRTRSVPEEAFISVAAAHWEIVFTRQHGRSWVTVRGPETKASIASIPRHADFLGIQFKLGTFAPQLSMVDLVDRGIELSEAGGRSFWFGGRSLQLPDFENVDDFVATLARKGLIANVSLDGGISDRTVQRRTRDATGLARRDIRQIDRAHRAVDLLKRGVSARDTARRAGYADQAHLTRALKRFIGMTPGQLSFSFKTSPSRAPTVQA